MNRADLGILLLAAPSVGVYVYLLWLWLRERMEGPLLYLACLVVQHADPNAGESLHDCESLRTPATPPAMLPPWPITDPPEPVGREALPTAGGAGSGLPCQLCGCCGQTITDPADAALYIALWQPAMLVHNKCGKYLQASRPLANPRLN